MKKLAIVTGMCLILTVSYLQCNTTANADPRGSSYAGSLACVKCHSSIYNTYLHTAHYLASLPAAEKSVGGSFKKGENEFEVSDSQKVVMEKLNHNLFQTYYVNGKVREKYRFDIVFGGVKGESYLYWKQNELYQLPLSYYTNEQEWSVSPGYDANFLEHRHVRNISKRCLECHASYVDNATGQSPELTQGEQFDKKTLVYSIDCERCHGPGEQHVVFHTNNPGIKTAKFIAIYSSLSRTQKMDMCAQCHSGNPGVMLRSTFGFVPGDDYSKFKLPDFYHNIDTTHLDVHGNQVQLLESSKCFINSNMDCATCHDTHQNTRGNNNLFAQKCLNCHNTPNHTFSKMTKEVSADLLKTNCLSCHMPELTSKAISVHVSEKRPSMKLSIRTHHIATYPEEVEKILAYMKR